MRSSALSSRQGWLATRVTMVGNGVPVLLALAAGPLSAVRVAGAVVALLVPLALLLANPLPRWRWLIALAGLPAVTALQAGVGGIGSAVAALLVMPAIWFGLFGTQRERLVGLVTLAACCVGPMLVLGAPDYPVDWPGALLLLVVATGVGLANAGVRQEVTRATRALRRQATSDELSGVLNRRGFLTAAEDAVARATEIGRPVTVVAFDLDDFKRVNDTHGHDAGDRCIAAMGAGLRAALRDHDVVGRIGGDEFVALLPRAGAAAALTAVGRVQREATGAGQFSAGVAEREPGETLPELLRRADRALYAAKAAGRGRAVVDDPVAARSA